TCRPPCLRARPAPDARGPGPYVPLPVAGAGHRPAPDSSVCWALTLARASSTSARRSRALATTAAGAFSRKAGLASLASARARSAPTAARSRSQPAAPPPPLQPGPPLVQVEQPLQGQVELGPPGQQLGRGGRRRRPDLHRVQAG